MEFLSFLFIFFFSCTSLISSLFLRKIYFRGLFFFFCMHDLLDLHFFTIFFFPSDVLFLISANIKDLLEFWPLIFFVEFGTTMDFSYFLNTFPFWCL
ncbi:hypothetical protein IC582_022642 [Cucumis melo]